MLLKEFAIYPNTCARIADPSERMAFGRSTVIGHAYAAALGRYETKGTWKVMVEFLGTDPTAPTVGLNVSDTRDSVGVAMLGLAEDFRSTPLAADDEEHARLYALDLIHSTALMVAGECGWDAGPLVSAFEAVRANPRFLVEGPWKSNRGKTRRARILWEEDWRGSTYQLEVENSLTGESVVTEPQRNRLAYIGSQSSGARSELRGPIWETADRVVVRDSKDVVLMDLSVP